MSQADSPNTMSPSRRALLAGAPAVAVAALTGETIENYHTDQADKEAEIARLRASLKRMSMQRVRRTNDLLRLITAA
jgi:hypothetical protein